MNWFRSKHERRRHDDTHEWERQRALYLQRSDEFNTEFARFSGRKSYKRLPVGLNTRGSLGI